MITGVRLKNSIIYSGQFIEGLNLCLVDTGKFLNSLNLQEKTKDSPKNITFKKNDFPLKFFSSSELEEFNGFKTLKKQIECMCGRIAVKKLVIEETEEVFPSHIEISKKESGAPYLKKYPDINISMSHSNNFAVGALSRQFNIGADIEKIQNINFDHLLNAGFSKREQEILKNKTNADIFKAWTIKESFLKLIKKGFGESLKKTEVIDDKIIYKGRLMKKISIFSVNLFKDYILSMVIEES